MRSLPPGPNQLRIRCRYRLTATRFHRVGEVQVENSHPQFKKPLPTSPCGDTIFIVSGKCKLKTRTHMGKLAPTIQKPWLVPTILSPRLPLVATRFHLVSSWRHDLIVSGKCKLKTRTHMGKRAPTGENSHPQGKTRTHRGKRAPTIQKPSAPSPHRTTLFSASSRITDGLCSIASDSSSQANDMIVRRSPGPPRWAVAPLSSIAPEPALP